MGIDIYLIQPSESFLCEEAVEFFSGNPDMLFSYKDPIIIHNYPKGRGFKYVLEEGHHRLYVCHKLGITDIPVEPVSKLSNALLSAAREVRKRGIRTVADLEGHLLPEFICAALLF